MGLDNKGIMEVKRAYKASTVFITLLLYSPFLIAASNVQNTVFLENNITLSLLIDWSIFWTLTKNTVPYCFRFISLIVIIFADL